MSQENVRVIKRAIAAVNERDIDGYLACCTEDIVLRTQLAGVVGAYEGPDAIRRFFADIEDTAPDFQLHVERLDSIGEDRALAFLHATASGRVSGVPINMRTANVYDFAAGKIGGVHAKVVQERLGHATIGITLDTYSHVLPGMQEDAAARVAALIAD